MSGPSHLVLLARWPRPGRVKTRLAAALGDALACRLHRAMVADARDRLRRFSAAGWTVRLLWADDAAPSGPTRRLRSGEGLQREGSLGDRMAAAMDEAFRSGATTCVLIGTDSPTLPDARIRDARDALGTAPVAFGPARDGGYYLVAAHRAVPPIFDDVPWGTAEVLARSLALARGRGLRCALLPPHDDVDRPEDLARLRRELATDDHAARRARHTVRALREAAR